MATGSITWTNTSTPVSIIQKDYEKLVNSITAKEVQDFLAKLLKQNNEIQVIMTVPEENK